MKKLTKLINLVKNKYRLGSHDWTHIQRTIANARALVGKDRPELDIILAGAVLHDMDRVRGKREHVKQTSNFSAVLRRAGYGGDKIKKIINVIRRHSLSSRGSPETSEEKILYDADKLDSYGAIGVARFFMMAGENGWSLKRAIREAERRIQKTKRTRIAYTKNGILGGRKKAAFSLKFYRQLRKEITPT